VKIIIKNKGLYFDMLHDLLIRVIMMTLVVVILAVSMMSIPMLVIVRIFIVIRLSYLENIFGLDSLINIIYLGLHEL
jgi:hypothetical protein